MDLKEYYENALFLEDGFQDIIQSSEDFYNLTLKRDEAFIDNMLEKMEHQSASAPGTSQNKDLRLTGAPVTGALVHGVLITGGYHTPNLKKLLKERNISYIVLTPTITHETNTKRYEQILLNRAQGLLTNPHTSTPGIIPFKASTAGPVNIMQAHQNRLSGEGTDLQLFLRELDIPESSVQRVIEMNATKDSRREDVSPTNGARMALKNPAVQKRQTALLEILKKPDSPSDINSLLALLKKQKDFTSVSYGQLYNDLKTSPALKKAYHQKINGPRDLQESEASSQASKLVDDLKHQDSQVRSKAIETISKLIRGKGDNYKVLRLLSSTLVEFSISHFDWSVRQAALNIVIELGWPSVLEDLARLQSAYIETNRPYISIGFDQMAKNPMLIVLEKLINPDPKTRIEAINDLKNDFKQENKKDIVKVLKKVVSRDKEDLVVEAAKEAIKKILGARMAKAADQTAGKMTKKAKRIIELIEDLKKERLSDEEIVRKLKYEHSLKFSPTYSVKKQLFFSLVENQTSEMLYPFLAHALEQVAPYNEFAFLKIRDQKREVAQKIEEIRKPGYPLSDGGRDQLISSLRNLGYKNKNAVEFLGPENLTNRDSFKTPADVNVKGLISAYYPKKREVREWESFHDYDNYHINIIENLGKAQQNYQDAVGFLAELLDPSGVGTYSKYIQASAKAIDSMDQRAFLALVNERDLEKRRVLAKNFVIVKTESALLPTPDGARLAEVELVSLFPGYDFRDKDMVAFPIEDDAVVAGAKAVDFAFFGFDRVGVAQWVAAGKIVFDFVNDKLLGLNGELLKRFVSLLGEKIGHALIPSLFSISLEETRPDLRDFSMDSQNSGLEHSTNSSKSSKAFLSKKKPLVLTPFLSEMIRTNPLSLFSGWFLSSSISTIFSSKSNDSKVIVAPPYEQAKYTTAEEKFAKDARIAGNHPTTESEGPLSKTVKKIRAINLGARMAKTLTEKSLKRFLSDAFSGKFSVTLASDDVDIDGDRVTLRKNNENPFEKTPKNPKQLSIRVLFGNEELEKQGVDAINALTETLSTHFPQYEIIYRGQRMINWSESFMMEAITTLSLKDTKSTTFSKKHQKSQPKSAAKNLRPISSRESYKPRLQMDGLEGFKREFFDAIYSNSDNQKPEGSRFSTLTPELQFTLKQILWEAAKSAYRAQQEFDKEPLGRAPDYYSQAAQTLEKLSRLLVITTDELISVFSNNPTATVFFKDAFEQNRDLEPEERTQIKNLLAGARMAINPDSSTNAVILDPQTDLDDTQLKKTLHQAVQDAATKHFKNTYHKDYKGPLDVPEIALWPTLEAEHFEKIKEAFKRGHSVQINAELGFYYPFEWAIVYPNGSLPGIEIQEIEGTRMALTQTKLEELLATPLRLDHQGVDNYLANGLNYFESNKDRFHSSLEIRIDERGIEFGAKVVVRFYWEETTPQVPQGEFNYHPSTFRPTAATKWGSEVAQKAVEALERVFRNDNLSSLYRIDRTLGPGKSSGPNGGHHEVSIAFIRKDAPSVQLSEDSALGQKRIRTIDHGARLSEEGTALSQTVSFKIDRSYSKDGRLFRDLTLLKNGVAFAQAIEDIDRQTLWTRLPEGVKFQAGEYYKNILEYLHLRIHQDSKFKGTRRGLLVEWIDEQNLDAQTLWLEGSKSKDYKKSATHPYRHEGGFNTGFHGTRSRLGRKDIFRLDFKLENDSEDKNETIVVKKVYETAEGLNLHSYVVLPRKEIVFAGVGTINSQNLGFAQELGIDSFASNRNPGNVETVVRDYGVPVYLLDERHKQAYDSYYSRLNGSISPVRKTLADLIEEGWIEGIVEGFDGEFTRTVNGKEEAVSVSQALRESTLLNASNKKMIVNYQGGSDVDAKDGYINPFLLDILGLPFVHENKFDNKLFSCNGTTTLGLLAVLGLLNGDIESTEIDVLFIRRTVDYPETKLENPKVSDKIEHHHTDEDIKAYLDQLKDALPRELREKINFKFREFTTHQKKGLQNQYHKVTAAIRIKKKDGTYLAADEYKNVAKKAPNLAIVNIPDFIHFKEEGDLYKAADLQEAQVNKLAKYIVDHQGVQEPMITPVVVEDLPDGQGFAVGALTFQKHNVVLANLAVLLLQLGLVPPTSAGVKEAVRRAMEITGMDRLKQNLETHDFTDGKPIRKKAVQSKKIAKPSEDLPKPALALNVETISKLVGQIETPGGLGSFEAKTNLPFYAGENYRNLESLPALLEALKLGDNHDEIKKTFRESIYKMGQEVIPQLIKHLHDDGLRQEIGKIFALFGKKAVGFLLNGLETENELEKTHIRQILNQMDFSSIASVLAENWDRPVVGAEARQIFLDKRAEAIPVLIELLADYRASVQSVSREILVKLGSLSIPALVKALEDWRYAVREQAAYALREIGPEATAALVEALKNHNILVRSKAREILLGSENSLITAYWDPRNEAIKSILVQLLDEILYNKSDFKPTLKDFQESGLLKDLDFKNPIPAPQATEIFSNTAFDFSIRKQVLDNLVKQGLEIAPALTLALRSQEDAFARAYLMEALDRIERKYVEVDLLGNIPQALEALGGRDLAGQNVLARVNFNVTIEKDGSIPDDSRIRLAVPVVEFLLKKGATPVLIAHNGRLEKEKNKDSRKSLEPIAAKLKELLPDTEIIFHKNSITAEGLQLAKESLVKGAVNLLENVRMAGDFETGKAENRDKFAKALADLSDGIFIFDAFGDVGSEGASVEQIPQFSKEVYVGPQMVREFKEFAKINLNGFDALIFGGVKMEKLDLLKALMARSLLPGGFALIGSGPSSELNKKKNRLLLQELRAGDKQRILTATDYSHDNTYDIGPKTIKQFLVKLKTLKPGQTVLLNGTMGWVEKGYAFGTTMILNELKDLAKRGIKIVVVGGNASETAREVGLEGVENVIFFSGGGVPLKMLAGEKLVALKAMRKAMEAKSKAKEAKALVPAPPASIEHKINALIKKLDDYDVDVRVKAILALAKMGETAKTAIPHLVKALNDPASVGIRYHAINALGDIGAQETVAPSLLPFLNDKELLVRSAAIATLAKIKITDLKLSEELKKALEEIKEKDKSDFVKQAAKDAIEKIRGARLAEKLITLKRPPIQRHDQLRLAVNVYRSTKNQGYFAVAVQPQGIPDILGIEFDPKEDSLTVHFNETKSVKLRNYRVEFAQDKQTPKEFILSGGELELADLRFELGKENSALQAAGKGVLTNSPKLSYYHLDGLVSENTKGVDWFIHSAYRSSKRNGYTVLKNAPRAQINQILGKASELYPGKKFIFSEDEPLPLSHQKASRVDVVAVDPNRIPNLPKGQSYVIVKPIGKNGIHNLTALFDTALIQAEALPQGMQTSNPLFNRLRDAYHAMGVEIGEDVKGFIQFTRFVGLTPKTINQWAIGPRQINQILRAYALGARMAGQSV
jgi:phosphoglycerate kinase